MKSNEIHHRVPIDERYVWDCPIFLTKKNLTRFDGKAQGAVAKAHPGFGRHPRTNPERVPQSSVKFANGLVEPRWGSVWSSSFPGVRRVAATPGYDVQPVPG